MGSSALSEKMLINHILPREMVHLDKPLVTYFSCEKGLHQEGHLAAKHCCKPERIYVISNIVEGNNGTKTSREGVINSRMGVGVDPVR